MTKPKARPKTRKKREVPWKEVSRQRMQGDIRVSSFSRHGSISIKVTYQVVEKRKVNGKLEVRWVEDVRTLQSHELGSYLLVETVARLLPHIEAESFDIIEERDGYEFSEHRRELVRNPLHKALPITKAILGPDRF